MVKMAMESPKLLKNTAYNSTRLLIIGPMITPFQIVPITSTDYTLNGPSSNKALVTTTPHRRLSGIGLGYAGIVSIVNNQAHPACSQSGRAYDEARHRGQPEGYPRAAINIGAYAMLASSLHFPSIVSPMASGMASS